MDFQSLFRKPAYIFYKNQLYSFRIRRRAIRDLLIRQNIVRALDIGAGVSPMLKTGESVVVSDPAPEAMGVLRRLNPENRLAAADGVNLPFKTGTFSQVICSEVLEHIENDLDVLGEIHRVLRPLGQLILTVPHRRALFAYDDARVGHFRRYDIADIRAMLVHCGFTVIRIRKVLGPLEKIAMYLVHRILFIWARIRPAGGGCDEFLTGPIPRFWFGLINGFCRILFRLDACIMPLSMASVILVQADRREAVE